MLRGMGYTVHLVNMNVGRNEAFYRGIERFLTTGRYVEPVAGNPTNLKDRKDDADKRVYASSVNVDANNERGKHVVTEGRDSEIGRVIDKINRS